VPAREVLRLALDLRRQYGHGASLRSANAIAPEVDAFVWRDGSLLETHLSAGANLAFTGRLVITAAWPDLYFSADLRPFFSTGDATGRVVYHSPDGGRTGSGTSLPDL
jgi:hypothetical protein